MGKKTVLVITDGIGYKPNERCNAFFHAKKPNYEWLFNNVPYSMIRTYGLSVGLPEGQMGNSEVGHMTIGAGRVLYQDLVKISLAIKDGSIHNNKALNDLLAKTNRIHLIGLMSDGGVHSHIEHLLGLAKLLSQRGCKLFLHLITDGRDVSPTSAPIFIEMVNQILDENIMFATLGGRFYTMDRDKRWERIEKGYRAIMQATPKTDLSPLEYVKASYAKEITDEFIEPVAFSGYEGMADNDGVIMVNFRSDRAREIITALGDENFCNFDKSGCKKLHIITMTEYDKNFSYPVMFPKEDVKNTLAEVISKAGLRQLHISETEKYAHVTFFLNGGVEEPFLNETRVLIPSPKVKTYDLQPQMSAIEVCDGVINGIKEGYDFIVVNFANGDMVGHTGNFEAAKIAVETVDTQIGRIIEACKKYDYNLVITSDHGNCEEMCDEEGNILTNHTVGDVWCFVMADGVTKLKDGGLDNIAPTILELMGLDRPAEMSESLIIKECKNRINNECCKGSSDNEESCVKSEKNHYHSCCCETVSCSKEDDIKDSKKDCWLRGLYSLILVLFLFVAQGVVLLISLIQFILSLTNSTSSHLKELGSQLGDYINDITNYITYSSDTKPFPFQDSK